MDYKRGKASSAYKTPPKYFMSRVSGSGETLLPLVLAVDYLEGMEVARTLCLVSKMWLRTVNLDRVWESFSYSIAPPEIVNRLKRLWKCAFEKKTKGKEVTYVAGLEKYIFACLMRKVCSNCWIDTKNVHFCKLLGRALCAECSILPDYMMISAEQVLVDFKLTAEILEENGVHGLTIPGRHTDGHGVTAYYLSDIKALKQKRSEGECVLSRNYTGAMQLRESELLRHFTEFGVVHRKFLKLCFETEGNPAYNFVRGRSQQGALKIAQRLAKMYKPWLEKTQCFIDFDPLDVLPKEK